MDGSTIALLDASNALAEHWPDLVQPALIALAMYLGKRAMAHMDERHKRTEDKFEIQDDKIAKISERFDERVSKLGERLAACEVNVEVGHRLDRIVVDLERVAGRIEKRE